MAGRIFINGMGRIGRLLLRKAFDEGIEVVGVNDIYMDEKKLTYLLSHDTVYGDWNSTVSYEDGWLLINGKKVNFYSIPVIDNLPIGEIGAKMIIDCSGAYRHDPLAFATSAMNAGANVAAISYPSISNVPIYVYGVNAFDADHLSPDNYLFSFGSCSLNATAALLKVINSTAGVGSAFIEVVRSYTGDQNLCDNVVGDDCFERGRAAAQNIVPTYTSAAKYIGLIVPELNGKAQATALRTPTIVGGAINASIIMSKSYTNNEINQMIKSGIYTLDMKQALMYSEESLVSSDVVSNDSIPTFLASQTMVNGEGNICNVTVLYDNEMGFVNQMIKLLLNCSIDGF